MTTGKTLALTRRNFVGKVMSLLFSMLSRLVITFLPRSKRLLISWLQSPSAVILEPQKIKSDSPTAAAAAAAAAKPLQSCPTLCDPKDGSPPGSPVPGIVQARTLEWGAITNCRFQSELAGKLFLQEMSTRWQHFFMLNSGSTCHQSLKESRLPGLWIRVECA